MKRTLGQKRSVATVVKTEIGKACLHLIGARDAARRAGDMQLATEINEALRRLTTATAASVHNQDTVH